MSVHVFSSSHHPGLSVLEGSGSQLSYVLSQQCLQRKRQTQVAVLWKHYDEIKQERLLNGAGKVKGDMTVRKGLQNSLWG